MEGRGERGSKKSANPLLVYQEGRYEIHNKKVRKVVLNTDIKSNL